MLKGEKKNDVNLDVDHKWEKMWKFKKSCMLWKKNPKQNKTKQNNTNSDYKQE